ncbi:hypothetical protein Q5692_10905 [Microcoleus sp. C2C3]|uniref:hypothetical protein n=1 Tax=unclassified Microcoleus TaxID=2642155 RepID=UPI002FCEA0B0
MNSGSFLSNWLAICCPRRSTFPCQKERWTFPSQNAIVCALRKRDKVRSTFRCQNAIDLSMPKCDRPFYDKKSDRPFHTKKSDTADATLRERALHYKKAIALSI